MKAVIQFVTAPLFYVTILPAIGLGVIVIVYTIRGMLSITRSNYTKALERARGSRESRRMLIGMVGLDILAYPLFKLYFEREVDLLTYGYIVIGCNIFFLYFIVCDIVAIQLARKRIRELDSDGSARITEPPAEKLK